MVQNVKATTSAVLRHYLYLPLFLFYFCLKTTLSNIWVCSGKKQTKKPCMLLAEEHCSGCASAPILYVDECSLTDSCIVCGVSLILQSRFPVLNDSWSFFPFVVTTNFKLHASPTAYTLKYFSVYGYMLINIAMHGRMS